MSATEFNKAIDQILLRNEMEDTLHGRVCVLCDKFISPFNEETITLKLLVKHARYIAAPPDLPIQLRQSYIFKSNNNDANIQLSQCLLSPRAQMIPNLGSRNQPKVTCCRDCKSGYNANSLEKKGLPRYAIANNMTIGSAPPCLKRLNKVELALLSQARFRGHLFTYWGGCHKSIKGWHSLYDVDVQHTMAVLENVSNFTQSKNIGVVLCGPFTQEQKEKVMKKTTVNTDWVLEAFHWLKVNNRLYHDAPIPEIGAPTILDNSEDVESANTDIETRHEMKVVFPDSTIRTGGCDSGREFDQAVAEIRAKCAETTPFLTSRPSRQLLRDYEEENLMKAFPLQFPYGYGYNTECNGAASQNGYLSHLLHLSIPAFHEPAFVLTVHNMYERSKALMGAVWQVMGRHEKCDVPESILNKAISDHCNGIDSGWGRGEQFLNSVKSVKKNMGHTNASAKAAQAKFISLTHHFGCAKAFLTVSFDDSLDIRIAVLSGMNNVEDWIDDMETVSPEEISSKIDELETIRYKYPGLCALNFQWLLEVVIDKIIGDNDLREGIFGRLAAYGISIEEQGRKTLHAHILVYTTEWNDTLRDLQSDRERTRRAAEQKVVSFIDEILSTELAPGTPITQLCPNCNSPEMNFADDQTMRNLRHRVGCLRERGILVECSPCKAQFQGDELAMKRATPPDFWNLPDDQLKAKVALEILKAVKNSSTTMIPKEAVALANYRFNNHLDKHTRTCFKKGDEGRCNLPDIPEEKSHVLFNSSDLEICDWRGRTIRYMNTTVRPKRHPQDAYTNSYCKLISHSKAPANSNIGIPTGARSTIYASCYSTKNTQKEDTAEFKKMASFAAHRWKEARKENSLFEGLSRLMGAVLVNTAEHVCSAPMASFLVRNNGSRFIYSERFKYIPVREMLQLIGDTMVQNRIQMDILPHNKGCFLTNEALNYLMRPSHFENLSLVSFNQEYEYVRKNEGRNNDNEIIDVDDSDHPGYQKQVVRQRSTPALAQIAQWVFGDAASFGGDIMELENPNATVENHCKVILVLYHPFRRIQDITENGSFHKKFKSLYHQGVPPEIQEILTNVQMFYNSMRLPAREDPLRNRTTPFRTPKGDTQEEEEESDDDGAFFDGIFDILGPEASNTQQDERLNNINVSLRPIRDMGARGCGFLNLPSPLDLNSISTDHHLLNSNIPQNFICNTTANDTTNADARHTGDNSRDRPTLGQLMHLIFRNTRRRLTVEPGEETSQSADGTVLSIINWSNCPQLNLDNEQRLSFQIVTAAFVLTYYEDSRPDIGHEENGNIRSLMRHTFISEKGKLRRLARLYQGGSLRMFLDGAGGSGKSRVVTELMKYAKQYTSNLNLTFNMRTIVVTALSGVAAISIGGETLHSAAGLNSRSTKHDRSWENARLLIVDEISFMNSTELERLDDKLRDLMQKSSALYGGIHVLFCGDFRQLEPCTGKPLYSKNHLDQKWSTSINCYIELQGLHRFKEDPEWGLILQRIRNDSYNQHDIDAINKCVFKNSDNTTNSVQRQKRKLPRGIAYCVYGNADRVAINAGIFSNTLKAQTPNSSEPSNKILLVKASNIQRITRDGQKHEMTPADKNHIYESCGDHCLKQKMGGRRSGTFVDPILKLYHHAPLMLVSNDDVPNGHANGTRVTLEAVVLKNGCIPHKMSVDGKQCFAVEAGDVDHLLCSLTGNPNKLFRVKSKKVTCGVKAPIPSRIAGKTKATINFMVELLQFALLSNDATTGHKLQGQSKDSLVISVWSRRRNWNYVALSRVKTRVGLYLAAPLAYSVDFSIHPELTAMLQELRQKSPQEEDWDLQELQQEQENSRRLLGEP